MPAVHSHRALRAARSLLAGLGVTAAAIAVAVAAGSLWQPLERLELNTVDMRYRQFSSNFPASASPIVVVDIDDASDASVPATWPWPRGYYAHLLDNLFRAGARAVVLDIIFDTLRTDSPEGDSLLAEALARHAGKVVMGGKTYATEVGLAGAYSLSYTHGGVAVLKPYSRFLHADSAAWGLTDVKLDIDGVIRSYYRARSISDDSARIPSLAVRAHQMLTATPARYTQPTFRIAFPGGARSFPYYSFYQVIDDSSFTTADEREFEEEANLYDSLRSEGRFRDKIVFVGSSMAEAHDMMITPFSRTVSGSQTREIPGVEVHAAALHTLLGNYHITHVRPMLAYALLIVLALLVFVAGLRAPAWAYALTLAGAIGVWVAGAWGAFAIAQTLVPVATPLAALILVATSQQAFLFYLERQRRREVVGMFGRYVPQAVVKELVDDPSKMRLGGERRELTVLFTDIEGFTSLTETLGPERIVELLNEYLTAMTEIVIAQGGIIDKYEGDLIMAEFGIPIAQPDHALRACRTAFLMQKRLHELHDIWRAQGKPLLRARTGIGSGPMVFGNMGSTQVFDYTVMGDVVNLASRLEGVNKVYGTSVLINQRAAELVSGEMLVREIDFLLVKGKSVPERCYQLVAPIDSPKQADIRAVAELTTRALEAYRAQQWQSATTLFEQVMEVWPDDRVAQVFVERCRAFALSPPPSNWDGVYEMQSK